MDLRDRYRGSLLGLAVGDALGAPLEFKAPGSFPLIEDMNGGGAFHLVPGQWTDDTSMALCLAESLVECAGFDARDQARRYVRWWREGHLSCTGTCFDIGSTVERALSKFIETEEPFAGSTDSRSAGNGSLMRLAPVPLFFRPSVQAAVQNAADSSRVTHGTREAVDACRYLAWLVVAALNGADKEALLGDQAALSTFFRSQGELAPRIAAVAGGSFRRKEPPEIRGSGYVVECLEAALWAFSKSSSFREGALLAVNLGDDADTTGAVYGQLAGAYYGASGIPQNWVKRVAMREKIQELADGLMDKSEAAPDAGPPGKGVSLLPGLVLPPSPSQPRAPQIPGKIPSHPTSTSHGCYHRSTVHS